jgi:hypothetical protein
VPLVPPALALGRVQEQVLVLAQEQEQLVILGLQKSYHSKLVPLVPPALALGRVQEQVPEQLVMSEL